MNPLPWERNKGDKGLLLRTHEFFYNDIVGLTVEQGEIGGFHWPLLTCFIISWILVYFCLRNGIKQTGKIAYVTVISPYVFLIIF